MKIEIDSSRPDDLRKLKREHEFALEMIDAALAAISKNGRGADHPTFAQIAPTQGEDASVATDAGVAAIIAAMPTEFNMRQAKAAADAAEIPDSRLRREIASLTEAGSLILVERGQGRRPATYRKA